MAAAPGVTVALDYNSSNGRLAGLTVANTTEATYSASVVLTDGRTFGQVYGPGTTATPIGGTAVRITVDAQGEATITGIDKMSFGSV